MRGGEVDAINPTFGINLLPLKSTPGLTFNQVPGLFQEHIDIQFGKQGPAAAACAVVPAGDHAGDRPASDHQDGVRRARGQHEAARQPRLLPGRRVVQAGLREVELQPGEGARAAEEALHGRAVVAVSSNSAIFTCSSLKASVRYTWTASNATRTTQEAIIKAQLKTIGIEIVDAALPANVVFGPTGVPAGTTTSRTSRG